MRAVNGSFEMPFTGSASLAMLALFWVLVLVWSEAGFVAVAALAALADLSLTLYARLRRRPVTTRPRDGPTG